METFLKVINLSKSYLSPEEEEKVDVFNEVNLEMPKGSSVPLSGLPVRARAHCLT